MNHLSEVLTACRDAEASGYLVKQIDLSEAWFLDFLSGCGFNNGMSRFSLDGKRVECSPYIRHLFLHCVPRPKPPQSLYFWLGVSA